MKINQPTDLPKNKDKNWLKRATQAISEKDLHSLGILANELDALTTKEKKQFVDNELWKKTLDEVKKQTTEKEKIASYKKYLKSTKIAYYGAKAQSEIDILQYIVDERDLWSKANRENTREVYESYVKQFPKSDNVQEAKERLSKLVEAENKAYQERLVLEEQGAWEKALRLNTKNSYKIYLSNYSNHLHTSEARKKREQIVQQEEEELAKEQLIQEEKNVWNRAIRLDSQQAYTEYLNSYPQHKNSQSAKIRLDEIIAIKKEKSFWKETKEINTIESYQKYIEIYPQGLHINKAQTIFDEFLTIAEKQQKDKNAWNNAQLENTVIGYERYLSSYPSGKYFSDAEYSINLLIEKDLKELMIWANKNNISVDALPRDIDKLKKITSLNLSNKELSELPKSLSSLHHLTSLNVSNNKLKELPISLTKQIKLESLDFSNNQISVIPSEIKNLSNLKFLNFSTNLLEQLPSNICYLKKLEYFDLSRNKIFILPKDIGDLSSLVFFNMENEYGRATLLRELPTSIWNLNNLNNNSLKHLNFLVKSIDSYDERIWTEAINKHIPEGYEVYLQMFKNGKYVSEAKKKLNDAEKEEEEYKQSNTINSCSAFMEKYPKSFYMNNIKEKHEELLWKECEENDTLEDYRNYIHAYPKGKYTSNARGREEKLSTYATIKFIAIGIVIVLLIITSLSWWDEILEIIKFFLGLAILAGFIGLIGAIFD